MKKRRIEDKFEVTFGVPISSNLANLRKRVGHSNIHHLKIGDKLEIDFMPQFVFTSFDAPIPTINEEY